MAVSYTKAQRVLARQDGRSLVTIDTLGLTFQGPVSGEEATALLVYLNGFFKRRGRVSGSSRLAARRTESEHDPETDTDRLGSVESHASTETTA